MDLIFRALPESEHDRLLPIYEEIGDTLPIPSQTIRYVAEWDNQIVGYIAGQTVICVSPIWVKKDFRGSDIALRLAHEGYQLLPELQKVMITTNPHVDRLAHALGFIPKIGQLWMELPGGR